jgi:phosphate transport system permease protein
MSLLLEGNARRRRKEQIVRGAFFAAAAFSVVVSALIIFSLFRDAIEFLLRVDLASLWTDGWFPRRGMYDIKTIVVGTLLVTAVGMLVAAPVGLGAAVYLSEYASPRARRTLSGSAS